MTTPDGLIHPGQCLVCGGRGGYPGLDCATMLCPRCEGTGRDPARGSDWYMDAVLPLQLFDDLERKKR